MTKQKTAREEYTDCSTVVKMDNSQADETARKKAERRRRIAQCEEAIATGMETPGTRHSCFEWDEAHWYARKRLGLD